MKAVSVLQGCLGEVGDLDTPLIHGPSALAVDEGSVDRGRPHPRVGGMHSADDLVHRTLRRSGKDLMNLVDLVQIIVDLGANLSRVG